MVRMKKRYGTLNKFQGEIRKVFPDVKWTIWQADKEIVRDYGDGFILRGDRGVFNKEFFILFEDPRRIEWAAMINGELDSEIRNATN